MRAESIKPLAFCAALLFFALEIGCAKTQESKQQSNQWPALQGEEKRSGGGGLVGRWQSKDGVIEIKDDGTLVSGRDTFRYSVNGNVMTLTGSDGATEIPFRLNGDTLTASVGGEEQTYTRLADRAQGETRGTGSVPTELVGKWCYMANINASDGGRSSNRCFTLREDGTYEYYGETSSSGEYGSTASQESDSGTWSATKSIITTNSRSNGTVIYSLEKRNHPKTGDPMLVLDGDAYVTYNQRAPW